MSGNRRVPFSGKKKKEQLKERKKKKRDTDAADKPALTESGERKSASSTSHSNSRARSNVSEFARESDEEVAAARADAEQPLDLTKRDNPWASLLQHEAQKVQFLDIPQRPTPVKAGDEQLHAEERMFDLWKNKLIEQYGKRLNFFELNLDVWRQLWRTLERSHVVTIVVDCRFPQFHFPTSLYVQLRAQGKPVVLVLAKADLLPDDVLAAWEAHWKAKYPELHVLRFAARAGRRYDGGKHRRAFLALVRKVGASCPAPVWVHEDGRDHRSAAARANERLFVAVVGHPNVGKSAFINGLVRRKLVSVSATPGHTKHLQSIDVDVAEEEGEEKDDDNTTTTATTTTTNNNNDLKRGITLLDSPGLVFPAADRPRAIQVLCGLFPIAQVRCPYPAIRVLAEGCALEELYALRTDEPSWTPHALCAALAAKRHWSSERGTGPDARRAALALLKDARDGRLLLLWPPPGSAVRGGALSRQLDDAAARLEKLQLSDSETEESSSSAVTPGRQQRETGTPVMTRRDLPALARAVSRQTGYASDDAEAPDASSSADDDAEQALDSGGSSAGVEGAIESRRRRRARRRGKGGLGMADYYRKQERAGGKIDFSDDEKAGGNSSDDEADDGATASASSSAATGSVVYAIRSRKGKSLLSATDAGSMVESHDADSETDSAEEAEGSRSVK